MANGMLLQPYVRVEVGGFNLSYYQVGDEYEYLVHNVNVSISKGDQSAPQCEFELTATPAGFEWFAGAGRELLLTQPFTITFGYANGSDFATQYAFSGVNLTTGNSPKIAISGTSAIKGSFTDNKVSFTMEDEISLYELPDFLKEKAGAGGQLLDFVWKGNTEKDAQQVMIKLNRVNQTPHTILTEQLKEHGMRVTTNDTALDGTVIIDYPPSKEGELEVDKPQVETGSGTAVPAQRRVFILGPGLMDSVTRKQKLNLGQGSTGGAESPKSTRSTETEQKDVAQKGVLSQQSPAQSENKEGTTGPSDKSPSKAETLVPSPNSKEARAALTKILGTEMDASFPMLPNLVGIKPRDMIVIPSLKQGGYIEDYEIQTVKYSMESSGGVMISITADRVFTGDENMLDSGSISTVRGIVDGLTTADAWNKFYWNQGPEVAWPLSG